AVVNREGIRGRNSATIAIGIVRGRGTKPSDIHVAGGNLQLPDGEWDGPVDSKLVLLVAVRKTSGLRRQFIEPARGNRVRHVAGSHGQKLCRADRNVDLCDWCVYCANVESVEFQIDPFLHWNVHHE